jgi:plastocyanin
MTVRGAALVVLLLSTISAGAGTVTGTVEVERKARRTAQRYQGAGGETTRPMERIPSVAFIKGGVAGVAAPAAETLTIAQRDTMFEPALRIIPVGGEISFPNQDDEYHNVFSYSRARRFDLGRYPKGESKSVTFDKAGIVKVYCEIHPWMRAAVVVVESPFFTEVGADGSFRIDGIPAGSYTLVVWNVDGGSEEIEVEVTASEARDVSVKLAGLNRAEVEIRELTMGREAAPGLATAAGRSCCTTAERRLAGE